MPNNELYMKLKMIYKGKNIFFKNFYYFYLVQVLFLIVVDKKCCNLYISSYSHILAFNLIGLIIYLGW